ncbi:microfibril-associated glycoprotein 4-like [Sabethes cyaneus]|uniref:microfibril-associated glycoprotein 4-like n=1 Tax=Sabethes cyaneus TaxID=53552 RepID=UPI00237EC407|nr:microfibril-associated glycoprotein 4-like [Sabethes cyaneus]
MATGSLLSYLVIVPVLLACLLLDRSKQEEPSVGDLGFGLELILAKLDELNLRIMTLEQQNQELTEMLNKTMGCIKTPTADQSKIGVKSDQISASIQKFDESKVYRSCSEVPSGEAGQFLLRPTEDAQPFNASCNNTDGNGWMVIQNRFDGSEEFYRNWTDYKKGFGRLDGGEFWFGLERIHQFTGSRRHEIMFELMDAGGKVANPRYNPFAIGSEMEDYKLKELGSYTGSGGDSFGYHQGMRFSTPDRDNDVHKYDCAKLHHGGWWYKKCYLSNLNGKYNSGQLDYESMCWSSFTGGNIGLKSSKIMIREV